MITENRYFTHFYIEISGRCNAKCLYCCTGSGNHRVNKAFMTASEFEEIVDRLFALNFIAEGDIIALYNWGEPLLNPDFDEILQILGRKKLSASLSSNFIKDFSISEDSYKYIHNVVFSICSLEKENYKRIYGTDVTKTLQNFDKFLENKNKYNPQIDVAVKWLRYTFNEGEEEPVIEYFGKRNVTVYPNIYAYMNDGDAFCSYLSSGKMNGYDLEQVKKDLCFERIEYILDNYAKKDFPCEFKNRLMINESGQLSLCCTVTARNAEYNMGDIRKLDAEEIYQLIHNAKFCKVCESVKLPHFYRIYNQEV